MYFLVDNHEFAGVAYPLTNWINPLVRALQATAVAQQ
jgi:hypothetical protein